MEDEKIIDQSQLAEDVANMIDYEFFDFFLVKPLDPVKVKKEFSKPVATGKTTDENGIEAQDFDKVETEVKEVNSDFRKGVVIKRPMFLDMMKDEDKKVNPFTDVKAGDVVLFRDSAGLRFDPIKDSRLLKAFDILGVEKK
jgi:co-chaperonin GroES (HSP10)